MFVEMLVTEALYRAASLFWFCAWKGPQFAVYYVWPIRKSQREQDAHGPDRFRALPFLRAAELHWLGQLHDPAADQPTAWVLLDEPVRQERAYELLLAHQEYVRLADLARAWYTAELAEHTFWILGPGIQAHNQPWGDCYGPRPPDIFPEEDVLRNARQAEEAWQKVAQMLEALEENPIPGLLVAWDHYLEHGELP